MLDAGASSSAASTAGSSAAAGFSSVGAAGRRSLAARPVYCVGVRVRGDLEISTG
jgi:hypothetical protein